jgi:hypothetical protein
MKKITCDFWNQGWIRAVGWNQMLIYGENCVNQGCAVAGANAKAFSTFCAF